jgi:curved DNA-binding protein
MVQDDLYATLGIRPEAGLKEIKGAYRKLAFQHHPDRNRDNPASAEAMKRINAAYAVLSDPAKRSEYDTLRNQFGAAAYDRFRTSHSDQDIFSGSDINSIFEEMTRIFGFRGTDEIFKDVYGQAYENFEFKPRRRSMRTVIFTRPIRSAAADPASSVLPGVGGALLRFIIRKLTGIEIPVDGKNTADQIILDFKLAAEGGPFAYHHRRRDKKLVVTIPKGVRPGQSIRLAAMGEPGKAGGRPGDHLLEVRLRRPLLQAVIQFLSGLLGKRPGGGH